MELDLHAPEPAAERGGAAEPDAAEPAAEAGSRRPGRPRLGVTSREVTLLPRHWAWLERQPNGASAALRRLVEAAARTDAGPTRARELRAAAGRAMTILAGDLPGYEEASRALYTDDTERLAALTAAWPADVRAHVLRLSTAARDTLAGAPEAPLTPGRRPRPPAPSPARRS